MQLKVIKTDGSVEDYLHTKVIGTISNTLAQIDQADTSIAEQLAEVVTYFLYHERKNLEVSSGEILSIIKAALTETSYEDAAVALSEHHFERRLKRCRIEVVSADIQELSDAEALCSEQEPPDRSAWDKSRIVNDLVTKLSIPRQTARTIASMAEQKIFNIGITLVPASLVKQLVLTDAAAVLRAQSALSGGLKTV